MNLLITGGCGFLGSNLAAFALARGDRVIIADNLVRAGATANLAWLEGQGPVAFLKVDMSRREQVFDAVETAKPDAVFHVAGQVAMTTSISDPHLDFSTNALGTFNLLEAVRAKAAGATVIYSSTNKVYGDLEQYRYAEEATRYVCVDRPAGFDETTPLDFATPYGCSKGCADQYMLDYARTFGLNTVVFRHSSMYGGRQFATIDQGWVGWFCRQALETRNGTLREAFTISGNGKQVRDVLHAEDMIRLYFSAVERIGAVRGQVFNIGGGMDNSLSLLELLSLLEELAGTRLRWRNIAARQSDQLVFVADIAKARRLLDWTPRVIPRDGIARMLEWMGRKGD
jgi:CDP-paratose 2-epimerase